MINVYALSCCHIYSVGMDDIIGRKFLTKAKKGHNVSFPEVYKLGINLSKVKN